MCKHIQVTCKDCGYSCKAHPESSMALHKQCLHCFLKAKDAARG